MIADTAVGLFSTSPWQSDLHRVQDLDSPNNQDFPTVTRNKVKVERNNNWGRNLSSFSSTSCGTSVASSECSDEPLVDIETDVDDGFLSVTSSDTGYLTTSLLHVFDEENLPLGPFDWQGINLDDDDDSLIEEYTRSLIPSSPTKLRSQQQNSYHPQQQPNLQHSSQHHNLDYLEHLVSCSVAASQNGPAVSTSLTDNSVPTIVDSSTSALPTTTTNTMLPTSQAVVPSSASSTTSSSCSSEHRVLTDSTSWSHLSCEDQLSVIEDMTEIVSNQLGLREQLEVIRIINPHADVAPTDTEFVIDLECLDNEKLQSVREYIKQQMALKQSQSQCAHSQARHTPRAHKKATKKQRKKKKVPTATLR